MWNRYISRLKHWSLNAFASSHDIFAFKDVSVKTKITINNFHSVNFRRLWATGKYVTKPKPKGQEILEINYQLHSHAATGGGALYIWNTNVRITITAQARRAKRQLKETNCNEQVVVVSKTNRKLQQTPQIERSTTSHREQHTVKAGKLTRNDWTW